MTFDEVLAQVLELLHREKRVSYRALKRRFDLDDTYLPVLASAVQAAQQYRGQQVQSWFKAYLGEAYRMNNQLEQAQNLAMQGGELARRINHPWGIGLAQRTLGRIAHTRGDLAEAERHLQDARATFDAMEARYDLARTHLDLASLTHDQGNQDTATTHLSTAARLPDGTVRPVSDRQRHRPICGGHGTPICL